MSSGNIELLTYISWGYTKRKPNYHVRDVLVGNHSNLSAAFPLRGSASKESNKRDAGKKTCSSITLTKRSITQLRLGFSLIYGENMSIYAVVQNGLVVNVIEWDGITDYDPGEGLELVLAEGRGVSIGYAWNGENFIAPAEPDPEEAVAK